MPLPAIFDRLRIPAIGAPLFIVSNPDLVIAQCKGGIVGSFPALNARPQSQLDEWIHQITEELAAYDKANPDAPSSPFAVNQIVHRSNDRFEEDMLTCAKWKVPIVITSLGARVELNDAVHSWGGITLHDIIDDRYARKAVEKGADGLIAVAAGAGGHAGRWSPFALVQEIRKWFDGPATCVLFGNVGTITGGIRAFDDARPDDGYLDIGVATAQGALQWARTLGRAAAARTDRSPFVEMTQGRTMDVKFAEPLAYELDGGERGASKRLRAKIVPAALTVCVPEE